MTIRLMVLYVVLVAAACNWTVSKAIADEPPAPLAAVQSSEPIMVVLDIGPQVVAAVVKLSDGESDMTVAQVLERAKQNSPNLVRLQQDAKFFVIQKRQAVDDNLIVRQVETPLNVEWDAKANQPTDETNHKLRPGDRIVVKPSPANMPSVSMAAPAVSNGYYRPAGAPVPYSAGAPVAYGPQPNSGQLAPSMTASPQPMPAPAYGPPPPAMPAYAPAADTNGYRSPVAAPGTPAPSPTRSNTAAPFFGNAESNPAGVQFRTVVEEVIDPSGLTRTVERSTAEPVQQQVVVRFQIFCDEKDSLQAFAPLRDRRFLMGDSVTISGMLRILETNSLITSQSKPTFVCNVGRPGNFMLGETRQMGPTLDSPPRLVDGTQIDVLPKNVGGALRLDYRVKLAENATVREIAAEVEFGRGQAAIVPLSLRKKTANGAEAANAEKPLYVAILPELVQDQAPSPLPAPPAIGTPIAAQAQWLAPTQAAFQPSNSFAVPTNVQGAIFAPQQAIPAAAAAPIAIPSTIPSTAIPPVRYDAPPAAIPAAQPAIAPAPAADENTMIKFDIGIYEDATGSLAEFMPPAGQPQSKVTDAATIGTSLRVLEKQKLIQRVSAPKLVSRSGEAAVFQISGATPDDSGESRASSKGRTFQIVGRRVGTNLAIDYESHVTQGERDFKVETSQLVGEGKAIIAKMKYQPPLPEKNGEVAPAEKAEETPLEKSIYVVITPEVVR